MGAQLTRFNVSVSVWRTAGMVAGVDLSTGTRSELLHAVRMALESTSTQPAAIRELGIYYDSTWVGLLDWQPNSSVPVPGDVVEVLRAFYANEPAAALTGKRLLVTSVAALPSGIRVTLKETDR
ncbi:hypothetical protein FJY70_01140 [candidate division WOR-3 bacterium]|nr:hypothetical protein [candidate division WOR-3 bacterium]MBM3314260.1 hypothetical protein [candidate division WOR-3 bacterium]